MKHPIYNYLLLAILHLTVLLSIATAASAQRPLTAAQKARQQEVRMKYAEAQKYAEQQKMNSQTGQYITVTWPRMEAAVGKVEENIEFYSQEKEDAELSITFYELQLVRSRLKRPEAQIGDAYSEFLYDTDTGKLIFYYNTHKYWWADEEVKMETRCYYNTDGSFSSGSVKLSSPQGKGEALYPAELQDINGMDAIREQNRYQNAFNSIANFTME